MRTAPTTAKGRRTRNAIIEAAAKLIHERGIAATAVEDVLIASDTGKSQMYHYFGGKQGLVIAVLEYQFERILSRQYSLHDRSCDDLNRWRDEVLLAHRAKAFGSCPLGAVAGQTNSDPILREVLVGLFDRWQQAIVGLVLRARLANRVPPGTDPDDAGLILLAALQGGTMLSHLRGDARPLAGALDGALAQIGFMAAGIPQSC